MNNIEQLTVRLLQALDSNYDVINMDAVLSVIGALENTTITKEQLEATRLAKYINLSRRRTNSEQLAKRAKSLLKKWREMVGIQQPPSSASMPFASVNEKPTSPLSSSMGAGASKWNNMRIDSNEPTSFVNLIPSFSASATIENNISNSAACINGPGPRTARKNRNFNSEHLVNSNSAMNIGSIDTPTIVIDIDDSNSGLNVIENQDDVVIVGETTSAGSIKSSKLKKAKKDKRKSRDVRDVTKNLVVIDAESSESHQKSGRISSNLDSMKQKTGDKSKNSNFINTNMSEILSLSNSSVSCVFSTTIGEEPKGCYDNQQIKAQTLTESDLSFTGKFGGNGSSSTDKIIDDNLSTSNSTLRSDIYNTIYNENSNITGSAQTLKTPNKSRIFGGVGYNSNDSVSNSHHSNFETVDSVSQGVPQAASNAVTVETTPQIQVEKLPKKRGRKKGSKGVDSLIAKDTSLSSQMLMQSLSGGSKKVKTTKELYAEMQNRKLGVSTPTSPTHLTGGNNQQLLTQPSRRDSFCSEPSLHSPRTFDACSTNATISTIATTSTTPDKNVSAHRRSVVDVDSSSDSFISGGLSRENANLENTINATNALTVVKQQLTELVQNLPPVPSISAIEEACASEIVPCLCKVVEVMPEKPESTAEQTTEAMTESSSSDILKRPNFSEGNEIPAITINVVENNSKAIETAAKITTRKANPKKSIFDLDFDDDDDPLHTLIAEVAAANSISAYADDSKTENEKLHTLKDQASEDTLLTLHEQTVFSHFQNEENFTSENNISRAGLFPSYIVQEDDFCPAKQRFDIQTQQITMFHINLLHNFFIPNVNGNWNDNATDESFNVMNSNFQVLDGLNVVPKLSVENHIRKDLRDVGFRRELKPKIPNSSLKCEIPFLGVARCLRKRHRKNRKQKVNESENVIQKTAPIKNNKENDLETNPELKVDNVVDEDVHIDDEDVYMEKAVNAKNLWNLEANYQKSALEAITINVDNDDVDRINVMQTICPEDSRNLLTIAPNVNDFRSNATVENSSIYLKEEPQTNQLEYPNISGDILNNNNNTCNFKFDEEEDSSCDSNASLKQTQNSINRKLRKHRLRQRRQLEQDQNSAKSSTKRKRRRKKEPLPIKIKCIKIAINGGITTERHIKIKTEKNFSSSDENTDELEQNETEYSTEKSQDDEISNDDGDEGDYNGGGDDNENDNFGEFHEVVTRDLSPPTAMGNNHIVLTIKKTPSKTNSPASNSPTVTNLSAIVTESISKITTEKQTVGENQERFPTSFSTSNNEMMSEEKSTTKTACKTSNLMPSVFVKDSGMRPRFVRRRRKRKSHNPSLFRFPDEMIYNRSQVVKKKHHQLFFPDEIYTQNQDKYSGGFKRLIFNPSSCSSSCNEDSEFELESETSEEENEKMKKPKLCTNNSYISNQETLPKTPNSSSESSSEIDENYESALQDQAISTDVIQNEANSPEKAGVKLLSEENNGLLASFNDICEQEEPSSSQSSLSKENNCHLRPRQQFRTGIRPVPNDASDGNSRLQQFKEWHQVLQLKSYNDEFLTVLPYCLLD